MKQTYNKKYKAISSQFATGNWVFLKNVKVSPNSTRILTQRPYEKWSFIIANIMKHESTVPAFFTTCRGWGLLLPYL